VALQVRRVVTGHDGDGKAIVEIDEIAQASSLRPGAEASVIWATESFPVENTVEGDGAERAKGTTLANGTVFRVISFSPGNTPRNHRTHSIDYAVVLSGEIDMEMDDTTVHLETGDVLVQRGTIHNWANHGTEPCVLVFVLIDAKRAEIGGKLLEAIG
jgi:quercetin dioxygenase-like cupin family protein